MACPLCGERCTCTYGPSPPGSGEGRVSVLIDPEEADFSEQQFEASVAGMAGARHEVQPEPKPQPGWKLASATLEETKPLDETPYWREEVTSRIENYRARRKRPPRQRSLSLDFERAVNRAVGSIESPVAGESSVVREQWPAAASEDQSAIQEQASQISIHDSAVRKEARPPTDDEPADDPQAATGDWTTVDDSNIIEFPRPPLLVMPPSVEELAEPVIDKPRILDAPEAVETAEAPLGGIQLEPEEDTPAVEFELPLVVAAMSQRVFAGLADVLVVALASTVFLLIVVRGGATLPPGKAGPLLLSAAPLLFWAVYEYMFLVHAGTTPGMKIARLQLVSFEGGPAQRRVRRGRALAMVLSCLSLGLGLLWALLDEDTLCWHDRISRSYLISAWS